MKGNIIFKVLTVTVILNIINLLSHQGYPQRKILEYSEMTPGISFTAEKELHAESDISIDKTNMFS